LHTQPLLIMNKYSIISALRRLRLMKFLDKIRYYVSYAKSYKLRRAFYIENPNVKLPPPYFIYETFNLNYFSFYNKSIETAEWLVSYFRKYKELENLKVLDWGCGPGRVIRHLPSFMDNSCQFYGTDYNEKYIDWCIKNISNVSFTTNKLAPPLNYKNETFDIVYGISIFTHLSKEMHFAWFNELIRVLKQGGILFLTLQGNGFRNKLTEIEKKHFDSGNLVVRSKSKEGHRTFSAFQPVSFVKKLIHTNEILEHVPGEVKNGKPQQDVWIIRVTAQK
jgi:ubiquinone/menaquinone biosynthesis C-methylase UbiE